MPIGSPQEILPNFERLDLTKLRQDVPNFFSMDNSEAAAEWSTFLSGLEKEEEEEEEEEDEEEKEAEELKK